MIDLHPDGYCYVNTESYLRQQPSPARMAFHEDGASFDRFQVVDGEGIWHLRHTWNTDRALWRVTQRRLAGDAWEDGGQRFECLGPWHDEPHHCVLTDVRRPGEYDTVEAATVAWQTWLAQERGEIAARLERLECLA